MSWGDRRSGMGCKAPAGVRGLWQAGGGGARCGVGRMGEAALQAGNSESIIRKHYLDLKSTAEAEQFFGIMPKRRAALESIPVAAGRPVDAAA